MAAKKVKAGGDKTEFFCQECGYNTPKWMGKCPGCGKWNTIVEEVVKKAGDSRKTGLSLDLGERKKPESILAIDLEELPRLTTGSEELDRVLGGGIIAGSMVLIVGDPGIGKSSLTLKVCANEAKAGRRVLYVTGEESIGQVRMRAERLEALAEGLMVVSETNLGVIEEHIADLGPEILIIDSIQTIYREDVSSAPGSVSQVRECAVEILRVAKKEGIATFLVGHVTKDGTLSGPRVLEHIVDTVLYFEGGANSEFRILRAVKNRFGSTNEIGLFEMRGLG